MEGAIKDRLRELAELIAGEQDPEKFSALVEEMNRLLDGVELEHRKGRGKLPEKPSG